LRFSKRGPAWNVSTSEIEDSTLRDSNSFGREIEAEERVATLRVAFGG